MFLAALLLAACVPLPTCSATVTTGCASPTPVLAWDPAPAEYPKIIGFSIHYSLVGGVPQKLGDYFCTFDDTDEDSATPPIRTCPAFPTQRAGPTRTANRKYVFYVTWYDSLGQVSPYSNSVTICEPPIWPGPPTPYTYN